MLGERHGTKRLMKKIPHVPCSGPMLLTPPPFHAAPQSPASPLRRAETVKQLLGWKLSVAGRPRPRRHVLCAAVSDVFHAALSTEASHAAEPSRSRPAQRRHDGVCRLGAAVTPRTHDAENPRCRLGAAVAPPQLRVLAARPARDRRVVEVAAELLRECRWLRLRYERRLAALAARPARHRGVVQVEAAYQDILPGRCAGRRPRSEAEHGRQVRSERRCVS